MQSDHQLHFSDSSNMDAVPPECVHLIVTSPPYPMIEMWDELFCRSSQIKTALLSGDGYLAFELMHRVLDLVWSEIQRVLVPGGIACINVGDATRTLNDRFALYSNHTRIASKMLSLGFSNLPNILWRKQTNAPNKFMGSGMMPPGAYVTLEHEYILVFRKGDKRLFTTAQEKTNRRRSAYFWEERNQWFSDVWMDLKGTRQRTQSKRLRDRSGAFPFELAYRLISMFSVMGDIVLDPFLGTGTTALAAMASGRNSIGYEVDKAFQPSIWQGVDQAVNQACRRIEERLDSHRQFIRDREAMGKKMKYTNEVYGFPVVTRQETELMLPIPTNIEKKADDRFQVDYQISAASAGKPALPEEKRIKSSTAGQLSLFDP